MAYVYSQARNDRLSGDNKDVDEMSKYDHLTKYFESTQEIAYTVLWDVVPQVLSHNDQPQAQSVSTLTSSTAVAVNLTEMGFPAYIYILS